MLADPLVVKSLDPTPATAVAVLETNSYAMIDAGSGRSTRVCAFPTMGNEALVRPATLTISHSVSNENNPVKTDRTLIRFDFLIEDSAGKELKAYAYAVFGIPKGTLYSQPDSLLSLMTLRNGMVGALAGALLTSESAATLDEAKFVRIIAGES